MHAKTPPQRYPSADYLAELLTDCLAHLNQPADHPLPEELRVESHQPHIRSVRSKRFAVTLRRVVVPLVIMSLLASGGFALSTRDWSIVPEANESGVANSSADDIGSHVAVVPAEEAPLSAASVDGSAAIPLPWEADEPKLESWDDQLGPILEHVQQRLLESNQLSK